MNTIQWMKTYFETFAEPQPNDDGVLHFGQVLKKDIYQEYLADMAEFYVHINALSSKRYVTIIYLTSLFNSYLIYRFYKLWVDVYPNVEIGAFKNVSSKCHICSKLSYLRSKYRDITRKALLCELFSLHRSMYQGERMEYYARQQVAFNNPKTTMSIICDGMAQHHSVLPYLSNCQFNKALQLHLQGLLHNGVKLHLFLTYPNITNDSNLFIFTVLYKLHQWQNEKGFFPDTLYVQVSMYV